MCDTNSRLLDYATQWIEVDADNLENSRVNPDQRIPARQERSDLLSANFSSSSIELSQYLNNGCCGNDLVPALIGVGALSVAAAGSLMGSSHGLMGGY